MRFPDRHGLGSRRHRPRGFSLIEMLVALSVFGLTVLALLNLAGENTRSALLIEQHVLATVVADNRAVDTMLLPATLLAEAASEGRVSTANRDWYWRRSIAPSGIEGIVRVDIAVMPPDRDRVVAHATLLRSTQ